MDDERALLDLALSGDSAATRRLVGTLVPIVQARVVRTLLRRRGAAGRDVRQEVEDLAQEVFAALFADGGKVLRAWDASRGLSLASFCGLIAEREAASILRSGRRSPWTEAATELDELEKSLAEVPDVEVRVSSREQLAGLIDRVRGALSPRGLELFHRLVVEEESVESVCTSTGMTTDAVYGWKSRITKVVRKLAAEMAASEPRVPEAAAARDDDVSEDGRSPRRPAKETKETR